MPNQKFILERIVFFICLLALFNARASEQKDIILGQFAPLGGNFCELGSAQRDGANLHFFDKVNSPGGINGRQIELITLDDACEAKQAEANSRRLIEKDSVIALLGHMFTNTVFVSLPIATAAGVPYLGPSACNTELYAQRADRNVVRCT